MRYHPFRNAPFALYVSMFHHRAVASASKLPRSLRSASWSPALLEISSAIGSALQLHDLLQKILDLTLGELDADQGSILLL